MSRDQLIDPRDRSRRHGLLVVYTGQGKGKTTAALGAAFRALGRDMPVAVVQFVKGNWTTGERKLGESLAGVTWEVSGRGFTWDSDDLDADRAAARHGWQRATELIVAGGHPIVVLDELTFAFHYGFVAVEDALEVFARRPSHVHVLVTGRRAPAALIEAADLVTEMICVKHPFKRGIRAQLGLDY